MNAPVKGVSEIDALKAMVADLQAKLEAKTKANPVRFKISEPNKCLQMFGGRLRRFGVTLYASEWQTILDNADTIKLTIEANKDKLAWK